MLTTCWHMLIDFVNTLVMSLTNLRNYLFSFETAELTREVRKFEKMCQKKLDVIIVNSKIILLCKDGRHSNIKDDTSSVNGCYPAKPRAP